MREALLPMLSCPETGEALVLEVYKRDSSGNILEGILKNSKGDAYPIIKGIPRFVRSIEDHLERQTIKAFGQEWAYVNNLVGHMYTKELLFEFISPLNEQDLKGKRIVELGCGGGRWLEHFADCKAEFVVGIDLSSSVEQAARRVGKYQNVEVIQADICKPLIKRVFDLAVGIGVMHYLCEPWLGLASGV